MSDSAPPNPAPDESTSAVATIEPGPVSQWLNTQGFDHDVLDPDHVGVEQIGVESAVLPIITAAIKSHGFDYLQCQGGYDEGPGERLVCFYHFIAMAEQVEAMTEGRPHELREVRLKVFLSREGHRHCHRFMDYFVVLIGRNAKRSTCMALSSKAIPIPSVC